MSPIEEVIIKKIRQQGAISFESFMDTALYYPGLGYYASPDIVIGRSGDFYTSPHLHPIYGAMIARVLAEMWEKLGQPSVFSAIEIGAGAGYLCKDICDYLTTRSAERSGFLNAIEYIIVEPCSHNEQSQRRLLTDHIPHIRWVRSLSDIREIRGCVFSNELIDAFPVHRVLMKGTLREIYVIHDGSSFSEELRDPAEGLIQYLERFSIQLQEGYRTEINLRIRPWLDAVGQVLSEGFVMTIDYGYTSKEYYDPDRRDGTLLCYHKHSFNDNPYQHIGRQDMTAHVNFSSLMAWGEQTGLRTIGFCPQGTFLTASGIDEVIAELYADTPDYMSHISRIKGLILPHGMGASHNVMIQHKGGRPPALRGFSIRNLLHTL